MGCLDVRTGSCQFSFAEKELEEWGSEGFSDLEPETGEGNELG